VFARDTRSAERRRAASALCEWRCGRRLARSPSDARVSGDRRRAHGQSCSRSALRRISLSVDKGDATSLLRSSLDQPLSSREIYSSADSALLSAASARFRSRNFITSVARGAPHRRARPRSWAAGACSARVPAVAARPRVSGGSVISRWQARRLRHSRLQSRADRQRLLATDRGRSGLGTLAPPRAHPTAPPTAPPRAACDSVQIDSQPGRHICGGRRACSPRATIAFPPARSRSGSARLQATSDLASSEPAASRSEVSPEVMPSGQAPSRCLPRLSGYSLRPAFASRPLRSTLLNRVRRLGGPPSGIRERIRAGRYDARSL